MPWAYAVPLGVGLVAVAAVAVILIEVVPAVIREERARAEERRRRLVAPMRARPPSPPTMDDAADGGRASGVEVPEGGWTYQVRQRRKARGPTSAGAGSDGDDERDRYRLRPLSHESHHVLGDASSVAASDFESCPRDESDDDIPAKSTTPSQKASVLDETETSARPNSRAASETRSEPGTAPFFSPPLSSLSRFNGEEAGVDDPSAPSRANDAEDPFADDAGATTSTLRASTSLDSSPSLSAVSSYVPLAASQTAVTHDSSGSTAEWVLHSPTLSIASLGTDEDGWSRLSDVEEEWSKVRGPKSGLGLEGMATH